MTNGVMAVILRYFTEREYDDIVKQLPRFQNLLLILYDHAKTTYVIMVALCNRADHYIFILFLLSSSSSSSSSSFFSSPNLSGRRLDVYHTMAHGVALVRI